MRILALCLLFLVLMSSCVLSSMSYAQSHPMDGMHLKMTYCMEMQREENRSFEDIGCKVGHGIGKRGVKEDILKLLVERMNKNKESYAYKQLVSKDGLHMVFKDESLGSRGKATVWQDKAGKLHSVIGNDD